MTRLANYRSVFGPPGTGKTSFLIDRAKDALREGTPPRRIGFLAYTKKAAEEGYKRMGVGRRTAPYFGTVHSVALKCTPREEKQILQPRTPKEFKAALEERLPFLFDPATEHSVKRMHTLSRHSMLEWNEMVDKLFRAHLPECTMDQLEQFDVHYNDLKREHGYVDFDDMLDDFLEKGEPPELDLLLVDEAQDLTAKLWRSVEKLAERTALVYLAGDDDQMLYRWAGADDGAFRSYFDGALVLEQSYRCSKAVARKAHDVIRPVQYFPKAWRPTEEEGEIVETRDLVEAPLQAGQWFVLCRTNGRVRVMARKLKEHLIYYQTVMHGVTERGYSQAMTRLLRWWKAQPFVSKRDDEWALKTLQLSELRDVPKDLKELLYLTFKRSEVMTLEDMSYAYHLHEAGEDLLEQPRITVMTFHQAKGLEADNVLIDTHGSRRMRDEWDLDHGPEARAAYVAMTRARRQVWLYDQYGTSLDCWSWQ